MGNNFRIKILVVDDRENNLLSIETILEKEGYEIVRASSGKQALMILLKDVDFSLILMDVEMPELNGFDTATLIYQRDKLKHIPIIFITAHSYGDENIFRGYKTGAVDYLYKPVQPDLLRAKVSVFGELYKKNHQLIAQEQKLTAINKSLEIEIAERIASENKVKDLNLKLLDNISQLESTNKELDRFAYMASHDLQEPLRKIRIFSERIFDAYSEKLDEEGKMYIDKMQSACIRMQNLIDDILAFSKISVNKDSLVLSDMNELITEVLIDMDHRIKEKNAKIILGKLPKLEVNPGLIKSLFENLISNSLKYAKKEGVPILEIGICDATPHSALQLEKKTANIFVKDNGIGFDQQFADQVFVMFKRLHMGPDYKGTGIGLAICKKIIEEHGGTITANSAVDQGATFTLGFTVMQQ
jgi:signal transduction histidine kinase